MLTQNVREYLASLNIFILSTAPTKYRISPLYFNYGRLVYRSENFDKLFIIHKSGFPWAAAVITYLFAEDTEQFFPGFVRPYKSITINNISYTKLSPVVFEQFILFKFATLEHSEGISKNWQYVLTPSSKG